MVSMFSIMTIEHCEESVRSFNFMIIIVVSDSHSTDSSKRFE